MRQRTKPTGTNRSIGLIHHPPLAATSPANRHAAMKTLSPQDDGCPDPRSIPDPRHPPPRPGLGWPGGHGEGTTPDPIPNSAVKPSAPMVLRLKTRESRSPPGQPNPKPHLTAPTTHHRGVEQPGSSSGS